MFLTLLKKECKSIATSLTYYIIIICIVLFYFTNGSDFRMLSKPMEGQESYGYKANDDEDLIMDVTIGKLALDSYTNSYVAYPFGFYKEVTLNEKKLEQLQKIVEELTGLSYEEVILLVEEYLDNIPMPDTSGMVNYNVMAGVEDIPVSESINFNRFKVLMEEVDDLIGGGSDYNIKNILSTETVPLTYEEAVIEYENILYQDKLTGAYARLFCDYIGIVLGILPIFLAVTRGLRDKRTMVSDVIYSKKISSTTIILTRYLSTIIMILLPVLLISLSPALESMYYGSSIGISVDHFAFIKYIFGWLLPTAMVVTALGFFITEVTDSALGILIGGVWWLINMFQSFGNLVGDFGMNLVPRFNTVGKYTIFKNDFNTLVINRLFYSLLSIILIICTVYILSKKRKGEYNFARKIFSRRKSESNETTITSSDY